MKKYLLCLSLCILSSVSFAAMIPYDISEKIPDEIELNSTVTLSSSYLWRGQTQSANNAAVSGSLDISHSSGAYAGIWGSNIDYAGRVLEGNYYIGYATPINDMLSVDAGLLYYDLFGSSASDGMLKADGGEHLIELYSTLSASLGIYGNTDLYFAYDTTDVEGRYFSLSYDTPYVVNLTYGYYTAKDKTAKFNHIDISADLLTLRGYTLSSLLTFYSPDSSAIDSSSKLAISLSKDI